MITVQDIFEINPQQTRYNIITDTDVEPIWNGTELQQCKYRQNEVAYMRCVDNPYQDGFIELKINL